MMLEFIAASLLAAGVTIYFYLKRRRDKRRELNRKLNMLIPFAQKKSCLNCGYYLKGEKLIQTKHGKRIQRIHYCGRVFVNPKGVFTVDHNIRLKNTKACSAWKPRGAR